MSNDPRQLHERAMSAFGSWLGLGGGGEPNTPVPCPTNNGENNGGERMSLGAHDPNAGPKQPMGAFGGGYEFIDRRDGYLWQAAWMQGDLEQVRHQSRRE